MSLTAPTLIETCLELGPLTETEIAEALAGSANHPHIKAIISWLEFKIGTEHDTLSKRGLTADTRHESAGAADALKAIRRESIAFTTAGLLDQKEPS